MEKTFLRDLVILDVSSKAWYRPECSGSLSEGMAGPCARAFHVAVAMDCHIFIFGGRSARKRLSDFWMLDTDTWQWSELSAFGQLPSPRDFSAAAVVGNGKIVLFGGYDGSKWLNDVYVLDTISLEWKCLEISGQLPSPRCAHSILMIEKRMLLLGGRGSSGSIFGDLWALKGIFDDENSVSWTQLKLPGLSPAPRCGHSMVAIGTQVVVFGGHGFSGWIKRVDVYYDDFILLDRASVEWKKCSLKGENIHACAYHSMIKIGNKLFCFGGFDGKKTVKNSFWISISDDLLTKKEKLKFSENNSMKTVSNSENQINFKAISDFRENLGLTPKSIDTSVIPDYADVDRSLCLIGRRECSDSISNEESIKAARIFFSNFSINQFKFSEVKILFLDYLRMIQLLQNQNNKFKVHDHLQEIQNSKFVPCYRFYHYKSFKDLSLQDLSKLQSEYKNLLQQNLNSL